MKKMIIKYWKIILSILFGIFALLFWTIPHVSILAYQEQYQLFLFGSDYFLQRILLPGGLADYIAEFCTQFNYLYVLGGFILVLFFVALQLQTWHLCSKLGSNDKWYPLSFIPSVALWLYMSDPNVMFSFLVAINVVLLLMSFYNVSWKKWKKILFITLTTPVVYWLLGSVMFIILLFVVVEELLVNRSLLTFLYGVVIILYGIFIVVLCSYMIQYPLSRLFLGLNYYRYPEYSASIQIVIMLLIAVYPFLISQLPDFKFKFLRSVQLIVIAVGTVILLKVCYSGKALDSIEYDYLVRTAQWKAVINKSADKLSASPMEVSCTNFALCKEGQLGDRLFEFYQNGSEGLFPTFTRDMVSPVPTGEVFFSLGMINDARRYFFEAQEAIPNFRKSGRLTKRIIECEIINGQYSVAKKYLYILRKSLFYRVWAEKQLVLLDNPNNIDSDPVYGKLRKFRYVNDFLFSDREMDQMLGLLYSHCYENRDAYEYLMAYELVQRDMPKFIKYYPLGKYAGYIDHIPYAFQQALLYYWTQNHNSFQGMPWTIDEQWMQNMVSFIQTYMRDKNDVSLKTGVLGATFWSYMLVNKEIASKTKNKNNNIY